MSKKTCLLTAPNKKRRNKWLKAQNKINVWLTFPQKTINGLNVPILTHFEVFLKTQKCEHQLTTLRPPRVFNSVLTINNLVRLKNHRVLGPTLTLAGGEGNVSGWRVWVARDSLCM